MFQFRRKDVCSSCKTPLVSVTQAIVKMGDDFFIHFAMMCPLVGCVRATDAQGAFTRRKIERKTGE